MEDKARIRQLEIALKSVELELAWARQKLQPSDAWRDMLETCIDIIERAFEERTN